MTSISESTPLNAEIAYKIPNSKTELEAIYDLRYQVAKDLYPHLFTTNKHGHVAKDGFDDDSFHIYCTVSNQLAGCFRATPCVNNQWEIDSSLQNDLLSNINPQTTLQYNRIYMQKEFRNQSIHEFLFYHLSLWLLEHTAYTKYFATCNAGLVRMYKKLGAELLVPEGFKLNNRLSHNYYLIGGEVEGFVKIIQQKYNL